MAFKAILSLDGKEYRILKCTYDFTQTVDRIGKPSSENYGGRIQLTIESTESAAIAAWMVDNFERKSGKITFHKSDTDAKLKEVSFTEGYCIKYAEVFDTYNDEHMTEVFTISSREIQVGDAVHSNPWV